LFPNADIVRKVNKNVNFITIGGKMKRFSISLPDDVVEALEKILESEPTASRSKIIADSLTEYIARHHPFLLSRGENSRGPRVLRELKATLRRAPSPRRRKLQRILEGWKRID